MSYKENINKRGVAKDINRTPSGEVVLEGTLLELTPVQRRELLKQMADVISIYANAVGSITRPYDPKTFEDPESQQQALIENEVLFQAVREKAARFQSSATQLAIESKGNNDIKHRELLTYFINMLRESLDMRNATDREMVQRWNELHALTLETKNRKELELKLLAVFHTPVRETDLSEISEKELVRLLKKVAKYCSRSSMPLSLAETMKEQGQYEIFTAITQMINSKSLEKLAEQSKAMIPSVAQEIRHLYYTHPAIPTMSDLEVLQYITKSTESETSVK